jgi:hypothetical protein
MRLKLLQTTRVKTALHLVLTLNVLSRPLRQRLRSALKLRLNLKMCQPLCQLRCLPKLKRTPRLGLPKLRRLLRFRPLW